MPYKRTFRHGVHPPELKELTEKVKIRRLPFPDEVVLPLSQHTGKPAKPLVQAGDRVERADKLAEADGFISAPVHASASGTITAIDLWPHPDGSYKPAIRIAVERYSPQAARPRIIPRWEGLTPPQIVQAVQDGGVVGLGGAAFPTHVKLAPSKDVSIDTIVINGCECEPYLTTDHHIMAEYPERVHLGIRIMARALGVDRVMIGIEKNKPDAIEAIRATLPADLNVTVHPLTVKYPQGAEKMLIEALLKREVPSGKLPLHVGVVVQNVGSCAAIAEIFETGLPLIERIVTVTGRGVAEPANLIVPVGTKVRDLIDACGGLTEDAHEVVFGGPMMGAPQANLDVPVLKGTTGVIVLSEAETRRKESFACIRCGHCLDACPVFLNPQLLGQMALAGRYLETEDHHIWDCMLCGCCSYVCPSNIPLSQLFQVTRTAIRRLKTEAAA
ncbi:MAG: electron transport complex subunit RsxC [Gemmatimonadota bacterium]|nr:MAG: electron transport complex subunit RsxC [Gemmatimonadota bacterium]